MTRYVKKVKVIKHKEEDIIVPVQGQAEFKVESYLHLAHNSLGNHTLL